MHTGSAANLDKPLADGRATFMKASEDPLLSRMARPGAHGKAELLQKLSDIARG